MKVENLALDFTDEQKRYLEGFGVGVQIMRSGVVGRGTAQSIVACDASARPCINASLSRASISTSPEGSCFARRFASAATDAMSSLVRGVRSPSGRTRRRAILAGRRHQALAP